MAYLHRLIFCALVLLSAWLPASSYAATVAATHYYGAQWPGATLTYGTDALAQCASLASQRLAAGLPPLTGAISVTGLTCYAGTSGFGGLGDWYSCPVGSTGLDPVTHLCTVTVTGPPPPNYCTASAGQAAGTYGGPGGVGPKSLCVLSAPSGDPALPGCLATGFADIAFGESPNQTWSAAMKYTGAKCAPSAGAPDAGPPPTVACPRGQVTGQVNGQDICYRPGPEVPKTTTATSSSTTTNPNGSTTTSTNTQETNCTASTCTTTTTNTSSTAGGTTGTVPTTPVTTTSSTTCTRGAIGCQTTAVSRPPVTTTTTSSGSTTTGATTTTGGQTTTQTGGTTTSTTINTSGGSAGNNGSGTGGGNGTGSGGDGDGGLFSGVCGAPPICDGDAVMCAVAAATFATNCTLSDPKIPTPLYDAAITKTGDQTGLLPGNSTVNVSPSQFDQTELLGAAAGMTDRSITVAGRQISIPFSSVNVWLARLGLVLQAVTFLVCARIVIRG